MDEGKKREMLRALYIHHRRFESCTFHNMKGETFFDIVDTGDNSRIKIKDVRGTHAMVSRQPKAIGTRKSREADDGQAPEGEGTTGQDKRRSQSAL